MTRAEKKKQKTKNSTLWIVLVSFLILELFVITWCRIQFTQTSIEMSSALKEQRKMKLLRDRLIIEQARLKSSKRLIRIASQQSGLIMPSSEQTFIIRK